MCTVPFFPGLLIVSTNGHNISRGQSLIFEKSEELLMVVGCQGEQDIDSDSLERSSDSEGELYVNEGLATITEEASCSSTRSSKGQFSLPMLICLYL